MTLQQKNLGNNEKLWSEVKKKMLLKVLDDGFLGVEYIVFHML